MTVFYFSAPACLGHDLNPDHPESRERLLALEREMQESLPDGVTRREAVPATREQLLLAHSLEHIDHVLRSIPDWGLAMLDADTVVSPESGEAALCAAGAVIQAVDTVLDKPFTRGFCAVRPPGHHAHRNHAAGFCLFNNVAIGALYALQRPEIERVAILDFDVHHGDGTQDIIQDNPAVFFASVCEAYPQYAARPDLQSETGIAGNVMNRPLPAGTKGKAWLDVWIDEILPAVARFGPQLILVSAGFDGHRDDPVGGHDLESSDYEELARHIRQCADACCNGRLVMVLEGGYNLQVLRDCVRRCLGVLGER